MNRADIVIDATKCRSMGVCLQMAPDVFDIDDQSGIAVVIAFADDALPAVKDAIEQCPTQAIRLATD